MDDPELDEVGLVVDPSTISKRQKEVKPWSMCLFKSPEDGESS